MPKPILRTAAHDMLRPGDMPADNPPDVDALVLVRLLVPPKKLTTSKVAEQLRSLLWVDKATSNRIVGEAIERLRVRGLVWPDTKFILTEEGKTAALRELGWPNLPKRQHLDWNKAKKALLIRRLGAPSRTKVGNSDHLAAWVLYQREGLKFRGEPTPQRVLQALAWRALGLPHGGPLAKSAGIGALLGLVQNTLELGAAKKEAPLPNTADGTAHAESPRGSLKFEKRFDVRSFARDVNRTALEAKEGRWVGNKVFVGQLWKDISRTSTQPHLPIDIFKNQLVLAARAGLILLSRADLVSAYPKEELRLSQIEVGGELYHFVETQHLLSKSGE